jgi:hypothetical protein
VPNQNPQIRVDLPQVPNNEWKDIQFTFGKGQWLPHLEPALIGPENFSELINLRYTEVGLEGVNGFSKYNTTALDASSSTSYFDDIDTGIQLRTNRATKSHVLVHAKDNSGQGRVYQNITAVDGTQGNFIETVTSPATYTRLDINGNAYFEDTASGLTGLFGLAPQNSVAYCNSQENAIFSGFEHRIGAAFLATDQYGTSVQDRTEAANSSLSTATIALGSEHVVNGSMEADSNWNPTAGGSYPAPNSNAQSTAQVHNGAYSWTFQASADQSGIMTDAFAVTSDEVYRVTFWVYPDDTTTVKYGVLDGDDGLIIAAGVIQKTGLKQDQWNKVSFTWTSAGTGSSARIMFMGSANAEDYYIDNVSCTQDGYLPKLYLMTTRPIQGISFDFNTAPIVESTMTIKHWTGSAYGAVANGNDGTSSGGITLAQDGVYEFDHTSSTAKLHHFQELYLYAYEVTISAQAFALIDHITIDPGMQPLVNVWDGVYRQPIQFQVNIDNVYLDYTLHVNQSSDTAASVGAIFDGGQTGNTIGSNDWVIVMFEEQQAGINFKMAGQEVNTIAGTMVFSYWNGHEWTALTLAANDWRDGTLLNGATAGQTGLIEWTPPTDEQKQTLFGSVGYAYRMLYTITGGSNLMSGGTGIENVTVDLVTGVPALIDAIKPFDFPVIYKNRLMLGGFSTGEEGNRMDFSAPSTADVWNGSQSSMDGWQSLRFGGTEKITTATQLYNRFGASVFSMLLVFKNTEVYLMTGDSPIDFTVYPVSQTVGCPAPKTLATAEVGLDIGQGLTRNIALWISHSGPMMFDGAVLIPIKGIENYFDPNDPDYVEWDNMINSVGWVDNNYKEYNVLLPSGSGQIKNNTWVTYDLRRKKWFRKEPSTRSMPQCAFNVMHTTGEQKVLAGIETGYLMYLETGKNWDGNPIVQRIRTGDFWPSDNIWDETLLRKFKMYTHKTAESGVDLDIYFYANTAKAIGNDVNWADSTATDVTWADTTSSTTDTTWAAVVSANITLDLDTSLGLQRIARVVKDLNRTGWAHALAFEVSTSDSTKGFRPVSWGLRYRLERKDDQAT